MFQSVLQTNVRNKKRWPANKAKWANMLYSQAVVLRAAACRVTSTEIEKKKVKEQQNVKNGNKRRN